jgi:hypothetical protein
MTYQPGREMIKAEIVSDDLGMGYWCVSRIDTDQCPTVRQPIYDYRTALASVEGRPGECHPGASSR